MRRISAPLALLLLLAGCAGPKRLPPVDDAPAPPDPRRAAPELLGVGLAENESHLDLEVTVRARLVDAASGRHLVTVAPGSGAVVCSRSGKQVAWKHAGRGGSAAAVVLRPDDPAGRVRHGDREYRGEFQVIPSPRGGGLTLVNSLDLESYLKGVVPWEIGRHPRSKLAALQAQAVAARTYTVSHRGARRARGFDVFASVMDQVYKGAADEDDLCNEAIDATSGVVLQHDGDEIEAYYSACCGGVSSNIHEVWARGGRDYLGVSEDGPGDGGEDWCAGSRHYHWRETWPAGRLAEILAETLPAYLDWLADSPLRTEWAGPAFSPRTAAADPRRPGQLWNLEVVSRTTSGRVADLAISTDAGVYHVRGDRTRWVLRPADGNPFILRSARFDVELERDGPRLINVATRGRGFGHGIGLCQTGALARAAAGHSYREILAHYYPGATLVRLPGAATP